MQLDHNRLPVAMPEGTYLFRSTLIEWARQKRWLTADGLKIGPYTVDEAMEAAESGELFEFAEAVRQVPGLLSPLTSLRSGVRYPSDGVDMRPSFGTTTAPIEQQPGTLRALPAGNLTSCRPSSNAGRDVVATYPTTPFLIATDGPPEATAAQRAFNLRRAVAAIVRARYGDEWNEGILSLPVHPPERRSSFSSMMRINKHFFVEVTRYVWSTVTDVNNLTSLLWQFEPSGWRRLPQRLQY